MSQTVNNANDVLLSEAQRRADYSKNGVADTLEMLRPNRMQSFTALLKDVKVFLFSSTVSSLYQDSCLSMQGNCQISSDFHNS